MEVKVSACSRGTNEIQLVFRDELVRTQPLLHLRRRTNQTSVASVKRVHPFC